MEHREIVDKLGELRDGVLAPDERRALLRHLEGCPPCAAARDRWDAIARALFRAPTPGPERPFVAAVMARLGPEPGAPPALAPGWTPRWLTPAFALAAAAALWNVSAPSPRPSSAESLLLGEEPESLAAFSSEEPGPGLILASFLGEP